MKSNLALCPSTEDGWLPCVNTRRASSGGKLRGGNRPLRCSTRCESEDIAGDESEAFGAVDSQRADVFRLHNVRDIIEQVDGGCWLATSGRKKIVVT